MIHSLWVNAFSGDRQIMRFSLEILCFGAVVFLLCVLAGFLKEILRAGGINRVKLRPSRVHGEVVVMDPRIHGRKARGKTGTA